MDGTGEVFGMGHTPLRAHCTPHCIYRAPFETAPYTHLAREPTRALSDGARLELAPQPSLARAVTPFLLRPRSTCNSLAGPLSPRSQPALEIRWLATERILKGLVGICSALLGNLEVKDRSGAPPDSGIGSPNFFSNTLAPNIGPILFVIFAIIITIIHLVLIRLWHPTCSVTIVTRARTALLCVALEGQFITLAMLLMPWHGWLLFLIVTWSLAFVGMIAFAIYKVFFATNFADETPEMKRRRIQACVKRHA